MNETVKIRQFESHEWLLYRDLRYASLIDSPNSFGRTLEEEKARAEQFWKTRIEKGVESPAELPLVAEYDGKACGLVWARLKTADPTEVNVYQMWVQPEMRRLGIAQKFMDRIIEWSRMIGARQIILGATCGDTPANRLYKGMGFEACRDPEPIRADSELNGQALRLEL